MVVGKAGFLEEVVWQDKLSPKMSVAPAVAAGAPRSALDCSAGLLEPEKRLGRI